MVGKQRVLLDKIEFVMSAMNLVVFWQTEFLDGVLVEVGLLFALGPVRHLQGRQALVLSHHGGALEMVFKDLVVLAAIILSLPTSSCILWWYAIKRQRGQAKLAIALR